MTSAALSMLPAWSEPVSTLHDSVRRLIAEAKASVEDYPPLCVLLQEAKYDFGDITHWPCDFCTIYDADAPIALGSLSAARDVVNHPSIRVVLSFCPDEMRRIRGQPTKGWLAHFQDHGLVHYSWPMQDVQTSYVGKQESCAELAEEWLQIWFDMCCKVEALKMSEKMKGAPFGILFHCFGGINRSAAALCAWLIFKYDLQPLEAVEVLLRARPSLDPWKRRDHVCWALQHWFEQRSVLRARVQAQVASPDDLKSGSRCDDQT